MKDYLVRSDATDQSYSFTPGRGVSFRLEFQGCFPICVPGSTPNSICSEPVEQFCRCSVSRTRARARTHTHTHWELRNKNRARKAVGETPQELQSSQRRLSVCQRVHSTCVACPCAPQRTSIVPWRSLCVLLL